MDLPQPDWDPRAEKGVCTRDPRATTQRGCRGPGVHSQDLGSTGAMLQALSHWSKEQMGSTEGLLTSIPGEDAWGRRGRWRGVLILLRAAAIF